MSKPCQPECECGKHDGTRASQLRAANHMHTAEQREAARKRAEARLAEEAERHAADDHASPEGVRPPSDATLRKYGITAEEWLAILERQGWRCPICRRAARLLRLNIDHDHVPLWPKMPPEERRRYVRGVLCAYCNFRRVNSRMPATEAQRIADYLAAYEARRDSLPRGLDKPGESV